jgi:hypothetical protein
MDTEWNTDKNRNIRLYNPANHTNAAQSVLSKLCVTTSPIHVAGAECRRDIVRQARGIILYFKNEILVREE